MWQEIHDFERFYQSPIGLYAQRKIAKQLLDIWPNITGTSLLSLGFCTPYLNHPALSHAHLTHPCLTHPWTDHKKGAGRIIHAYAPFMTSHHPQRPSPYLDIHDINQQGRNCALLCHDTALPFDNASFDYLLMIHMLEFSEHRRRLMQEAWRVLKEGGKLIMIVPSRRGIWCRYDHTPFGHGNPFNRQQLKALYAQAKFVLLQQRRVLYLPPVENPALWNLYHKIEQPVEWVGQKFLPRLAGAFILELEKRIFLPLMQENENIAHKFMGDKLGVPAPART